MTRGGRLREDRPGPSAVLRAELSASVPIEHRLALHLEGLRGLPSGIGDLLHAVGVKEVFPVHDLTREEIESDAYGFSRDLKLMLRPGADAESACQRLEASPAFERVRPLLFRHG